MNNMRFKKVILLTTFIAVPLVGIAKVHTQKIERIEGVLYIVQNEERFKVNTEVVTVKLKATEKNLGVEFEVINSNRLGYIDIRVPHEVDVEKFVTDLRITNKFESVDFNGEAKFCFEPNDANLSSQWYINTIGLNNAWNITTGNPDLKVAIIDSGVDASHNDLGYTPDDGYTQIDIYSGMNYTDVTNAHINPVFPHGTFVAGILGAKTNNSIGIAGISGGNHSKGITIIPYCIGNSNTFTTYSIDDAILDAIDNGVKVINISISAPQSADIDAAIEEAYANNVSIVCSSGNNYPYAVSYPASHDKTIAVGAIKQNGQRLDSSHYGTGLDLVAPGKDILSTTLNNDYSTDSGTSFASPQVAGVVALMLSIKPSLTPIQIRDILRKTCTRLPGYSYDIYGWNNEVGYGLLNAYAAVWACQASIMGADIFYNTGVYSIQNLPTGYSISWSLSGINASNYTIYSDTPSVNQCTIIKRDSVDFYAGNDLVLTAHIMYSGSEVTSITKQLTSVFCIGSTVPCYQSSYEIKNIPDDSTVSWNWDGSGMTIVNMPNLLEPFYSQNNYFTLQRNNQGYGRGVLTATITRNNETLCTIVKTVDTGAHFTGTWKQGYGTPSLLESGQTYSFTKGTIVTLTSSKFVGTTVSTSSSNLGIWSGVTHNDSIITFWTLSDTPYGNKSPNAIPGGYVIITVKDTVTCECYQFTFYTEPTHPVLSSLNVCSSGSEYSFSLDEQLSSDKSPQSWQLEIVQYDTGRIITYMDSDNGLATINTSGWRTGIYIAVAIVDNQIVDAKKIIVK